MNKPWSLSCLLAVAGLAIGVNPLWCRDGFAPTPVNVPLPTTMARLPGVRLTLELPRKHFTAGEAVPLNVTLHNDGAKAISLGGSAMDESSFRFVVRDGAGRNVPLTEYGRDRLRETWEATGNTLRSVPAHSRRRYQFPLSRMFDLSEGGPYTVGVQRYLVTGYVEKERNVFEPQAKGAFSSTLSFRVTDKTVSATAMGSQNGPASMPLASRRDYLYLLNAGGSTFEPRGSVTRYLVHRDGRVSPALDGMAMTGKGSRSMVASPDKRFLYVLNGGDGTISQFRIGGNGQLHSLYPATVEAQKSPMESAISPDGRLLLAASSRNVQAFRVGPSGNLKPLPKTPIVPTEHLAFHPSGHYVYATNGRLAQYAVAKDGTVRPLSPQWVPAESSPGAIQVLPNGHYVYVMTSCVVELRGGEPYRWADFIAPFKVAPNGTLLRLAGGVSPRTPSGATYGFRRLAVDRSGRFLYALNDQLGSVSGYRIGADGSLRAIPGNPGLEGGEANGMAFDPANRFAFVARDYFNTLFSYHLKADGSLVPIGIGIPTESGSTEVIVSAPATVIPVFGRRVDGLDLSARMEPEVVVAEGSAVLSLLLRNNSPAAAPATEKTMYFKIVVQRQEGSKLPFIYTPVAQTSLGHKFFAGNSAAITCPAPGQIFKWSLTLGRLFDLSRGGIYIVQVIREAPGAPSDTPSLAAVTNSLGWRTAPSSVLQSNFVRFKIDEPYWHWSSYYLEFLGQKAPPYDNGPGVPFGEFYRGLGRTGKKATLPAAAP